MNESSTARAILTCFVAVMMTVGFTAAPAAAIDDGVSIGDDIDLDDVDLDDVDLDDVDVDDVEIDDEDSDTTTDGLEVNIVDTNSPVNASETLEVTVEVTNHDSSAAFQEIVLEVERDLVPDDEVDRKEARVGDGDTDTLTLEWDTSAEDTGEQTVIASSDDDSDREDVTVEAGYEAPEEFCTDFGDEAQENVPFGELPWFSDLPEEAQPPGVPTDIITPEAVAAIAFGATPNQCEVQDPNDPSYDPVTGDDDVDPDADGDVIRIGEVGDAEGVIAAAYYDVTLDESGEGPGTSGYIGSLAMDDGSGVADVRFTVNDGEKDYTVDPRIRSNDDGTAFAETDVELLNSRLGVTVDCDGEECQPGTRGLPEFVDYPAFPAPTGNDDSDDEDAGPFPEEFCTDFGDEAQENVPFGELPWFSDLPEEAQPPGVPTDIITPEAVAAIAFGATPNQCEVQDPNDPSYDPVTGDDDVDPDADGDVIRIGEVGDGEGVIGAAYYDVTLNESGEGPGTSGYIAGLAMDDGSAVADVDFVVNDGEKDYAVKPRIQTYDDGTAFAETDVELLNSRLGVTVDCDGEECQPGTRGLPEFVDYPAFPAPTGDDD